MKTTIRTMFLAFVIAMSMMASGCSMLSYNASVEEIKRERIYASGDRNAIITLNVTGDEDTAIRAVSLGGEGAGIAIDVANWDAIAKHPIRQTLAAVADLGAVYGIYRGVEELDSNSGGGSDDDSTAGRDNNNINITGDGNDVNIGDQTTTEVPVIVTE